MLYNVFTIAWEPSFACKLNFHYKNQTTLNLKF